MDISRSRPKRGGTGRIAGLQIIDRRVEELKPDPKNPRVHSKKQVRQIAASIEAFGFIVPVLVDREGKVIAGHGRLLACRELGWSEVPTLCLDHLTPAQARAFMIADNRLTETPAGTTGCWRSSFRTCR
jgi:ParB-like chromosome segregation protein Spo0J